MKRFNRMVGGLFLIVCLCLPLTASGVELAIPDTDGAPFGQVEIPITVRDFANVAGLQVFLSYDVALLAADSITTDYIGTATYNLGIPGEVLLIWEDFMNPLTLANDDVLMTLHFTVDGAAAGAAALEFTGNIEVVDEMGNPITVATKNGTITFTPSDVDDDDPVLPTRFDLKQNYPNPFNPSTTISYTVSQTSNLVFELYNLNGQLVDKIDLGRKMPGTYGFTYHMGSLPSGIYQYRLAGDFVSQSKQMVFLK